MILRFFYIPLSLSLHRPLREFSILLKASQGQLGSSTPELSYIPTGPYYLTENNLGKLFSTELAPRGRQMLFLGVNLVSRPTASRNSAINALFQLLLGNFAVKHLQDLPIQHYPALRLPSQIDLMSRLG